MTSAPPQIPRRLGDYIVHRMIGQGGMGEVYEGEEALTRRRVALKLLRAELGQSERGRRQFVSEMSILGSLDDPHVVRCLHCSEIDGQLVMVLEYLDGRTLRDVLRERGALAWADVAGIAWQMASALRAAQSHRPPIVHRDLKPENTMCLPDGRVKVMDFGIAKMLETIAGATATQSIGTLQYMSPEQIDVKPLDGRSDLFSLGLVMWEMLTGRPPFVSESPRVLLDKICTEPTPRLPEGVRRSVPPGLEALILRLLEKDPNARPRDANEVLAALDALRTAPAVAPAPVPVHAPAPSVRPSHDTVAIVAQAARTPSGPGWLVPVAIVGVVAVLGIFVGVGWVVLRSSSSDSRGSTASGTTAIASTPAQAQKSATPACASHASHWQGSWTIRTVATAAPKASWIGGKGRYELNLAVDGCRLVGTGHKVIGGENVRVFESTGDIADDGTATVRYDVTGRNIAGVWTIAKDGSGTWGSALGDSSGTLTATRGGGL